MRRASQSEAGEHAPATRIGPLRLNDGRRLPPIGFGTFPHAGEHSAAPVAHALRAGYRLIDTALRYGNERAVSEGVERAGVPRDEIVVATKLPGRYHGGREARAGVRESLERLRAESIDLYLIHWPMPRLDRYVETWGALVEMREAGVLRSIGVSNFTPAQIERLVARTGVVPAVNQIEMHPYFPQREQRRFHAEHGIVTQSWSPLGRHSGLLSDPTVLRVASEAGVSPARAVLRWHLQLGAIPIPKSTSPERQRENLDVQGFALDDAQIRLLSSLERGRV